MDLANLYRRFYKWYDENISSVDFSIIEYDITKPENQLKTIFENRLETIRNLMMYEHFYALHKKLLLNSVMSDSFEELEIKLSVYGY